MTPRIALLATAAITLASTTTALAQPAAAPYAQPQPYAQPGYSQPEPYGQSPGYSEPPPDHGRYGQPEPAPAFSRWSFGFQVMPAGKLEDSVQSGNDAVLGGYSVFGRFRLSTRWEIELSMGKTYAVMSSDRRRELRPKTLSVLAHMVSFGPIDGYLRAGVGTASETYDGGRGSTVAYEDQHGHVGAGLGYMLSNRIGISGELRASILTRTTEGSALEGTGTELGLAAAYHF